MAKLIFIRHAQSTLFTSEDTLTDLGQKQASLLAHYWEKNRVSIDSVYVDSLRSNQQTMETVVEPLTACGLINSKPKRMPELVDYPAYEIFKFMLPKLRGSDAEFAAAYLKYKNCKDEQERKRRFQPMFEYIVTPWAKGESSSTGVESADGFSSRVTAGIKKITGKAKSGQTIAIFSGSGAPSVACMLAVGLDLTSALKMSWQIYNTGYTEFLFSRNRFSLSSFNRHPHIHENTFLTYL